MSKPDWREMAGPGGATTPVCEIDGGRPGPTWLLAAGVHGDEYEGPEAIRRAVDELTRGPFPGRVIALPVANPMAYAAGVRLTPEDQGNLNRAFPGDANGSLTARWAAWLWERFVCRADRLIDLHAGGAAADFEPVAGFYDPAMAPAAAVFGFTLWRAPPTPGVFSHEFHRQRGWAIGAELGGGAVRSEANTDAACRAMLALVRDQATAEVGPIHLNHDVLAPATGEWTASCEVRQLVQPGDLLGAMRRFDGVPISEIRSPVAARVLAVRRIVSATQGDLLVGLGVPASPDNQPEEAGR